jgi:hypothetical protein
MGNLKEEMVLRKKKDAYEKNTLQKTWRSVFLFVTL